MIQWVPVIPPSVHSPCAWLPVYHLPNRLHLQILLLQLPYRKLFTTGTASGEEILQLNEEAIYNHKPELAANLSQAKYHSDSEIELVDGDILSRTGHIKHALFDHDGTISTLRQGWEAVMEPMMIKAILGDKYEKTDSSSTNRSETR